MNIREKLYEHFSEKASKTAVDFISVGIKYTVVGTSDGGIGLSYTAFDYNRSCAIAPDENHEGKPAGDLLTYINSRNLIHRSMALALINALNYHDALALPEDRKNTILFDLFGIRKDSRVAMAGFFKSLSARLREKQVQLEIVDIGRKIGDSRSFMDKLGNWADALIMTSTSILNDTADDLLTAVGQGVRVAMIGPSTPLVAAPFSALPVHMLAGTAPVDRDETFKAVRHGKGTPTLQKFARKPYLEIG